MKKRKKFVGIKTDKRNVLTEVKMAKTRTVVRYRSAKRRGKKPGFTLPLAVVAGFGPVAVRTWQYGNYYGWLGNENSGLAEFSRDMIGINPYSTPVKFEGWRLQYGLLPVAIGLGIHKVASMLGINRMIARAGIPVVRI